MLGPTESLLMYYLATGLAIFLAWAACLPTHELTPDEIRRYQRWSTIAAAAGVLHPGIAFAARDILSQVRLDIPAQSALTRAQHRATRMVDVLMAVSLVAAAAVIFMVVRA